MSFPASRTLRAARFAAGVPLVVSGESFARAALPENVAACAAFVSDQDRLACYDRASARDPTPVAEVGSGTERTSTPMSAPAAQASAQAVTAAKPGDTDPDPMLESIRGFEPGSERHSIRLYRPSDLQLASDSSRPNEQPFEQLFSSLQDEDAEVDATEAQFRISFKARLCATDDRRLGLWGACTQQSHWQVYNDRTARPFRETNDEPELLVSYDPELAFAGLRWRLFNFGSNHRSNGCSDPISRSWHRLIAERGLERGDFALLIRPWLIIDDGEDDNPDIED